ncbi:reverse transcriptase domain-containing protein [Danxiaibacter flavus]|uniref:Reverse transcriptase domain-containing protein n=1 Tax=Danxiaibacter flavus TaxID=3049108 RepID=A0ABV3ZL97_9BACT|nr:reverse transcriptase domain-containing protein [Chitinophagaceae bacterium DXS]
MSPGSDGSTIDKMSLERISNLIEKLRTEQYKPTPVRRIYILKKNGKQRPIGIPSFDDKLVQEVIRMILEAIFEKQFDNSSHGFRPHKSCHTALKQVHNRFTGVKWFIEGDIEGFFDNINHDTMICILRHRIADERFLRLIRKFLNAGYLEDWKYHKTFSGTPQGGIVSPILANIYLDQLDKYIRQYIAVFDEGKRREQNEAYHKLSRQKAKLLYKFDRLRDLQIRKERIEKVKIVESQRKLLSSGNEMDSRYKRLKYVRYADDFLIGIIGSKRDCEQIKADIQQYLKENLNLTLSAEKTLITQSNKAARFLGYDVSIRKSNHTKRTKDGHLMRTFQSKVILDVPNKTILKKLFSYEAVKLIYDHNGEKWKPTKRIKLQNNDDLEILNAYNTEIKGFTNYYRIANNSSALHDFRYIMEYSMYKTFAAKYRTTVGKIRSKYRHGKDFAVTYTGKNGVVKRNVFRKESFQRVSYSTLVTDNLPNTITVSARTSLIDRLQAQTCEACGATNQLQMHHVRKLKDLQGNEPWKILMIARRRKTLAVCYSCHRKIHNGKMD